MSYNSRIATYIYIIYIPNLGFEIAFLDQEREQGRFRGSSKGARGALEGAGGAQREHRGKHEGAKREHGRAEREHGRAEREQINETGDSAGAKLSSGTQRCYIYI